MSALQILGISENRLSGKHERISYYELEEATEGFSESNLLGNGSFIKVFKGIFGLRMILFWQQRYSMAIRGYGYSTPVVHCDLKTSNVLLDHGMVGHVCDFGIAKLLVAGQDFVQTRTTTTIGYIAPAIVTSIASLPKTIIDWYSILVCSSVTRKFIFIFFYRDCRIWTRWNSSHKM
ncbi:hypothetical protein MTR67_003429 [Solanum verrucosum]|uniref:Protein kinase domain-containing protein n=1 Tax=Solanum verrucosum TaxID=315347 RepID=A0AAF0T9P0_SOLVR|nr:hypothetical protein MTR67_003429 [Solanum verrucosum]